MDNEQKNETGQRKSGAEKRKGGKNNVNAINRDRASSLQSDIRGNRNSSKSRDDRGRNSEQPNRRDKGRRRSNQGKKKRTDQTPIPSRAIRYAVNALRSTGYEVYPKHSAGARERKVIELAQIGYGYREQYTTDNQTPTGPIIKAKAEPGHKQFMQACVRAGLIRCIDPSVSTINPRLKKSKQGKRLTRSYQFSHGWLCAMFSNVDLVTCQASLKYGPFYVPTTPERTKVISALWNPAIIPGNVQESITIGNEFSIDSAAAAAAIENLDLDKTKGTALETQKREKAQATRKACGFGFDGVVHRPAAYVQTSNGGRGFFRDPAYLSMPKVVRQQALRTLSGRSIYSADVSNFEGRLFCAANNFDYELVSDERILKIVQTEYPNLKKSDIKAILRPLLHGQKWIDDPVRNKIRNMLIALLDREIPGYIRAVRRMNIEGDHTLQQLGSNCFFPGLSAALDCKPESIGLPLHDGLEFAADSYEHAKQIRDALSCRMGEIVGRPMPMTLEEYHPPILHNVA
jgi:hypothetical protein